MTVYSASAAAQVSIRAEVDRNTISIHDELNLRLIIQSPDSVADPQLPSLTDFDVLPDISRSSEFSVQFGTGRESRMQRTFKFGYSLLPKREGNLTIPSMDVIIDGKRYKTELIRVRVLSAEQVRETTREEIFLEIELDKEQAYLGEQVVLRQTLFVFSNTGVTLPHNAFGAVEVEGFIVKPLGEPEQRSAFRDGRQYRIVERKLALFPVRMGKISIAPMRMVIGKVRRRGRARSLFDQFFEDMRRDTRRMNLRSNAIDLDVLSLPKEGRPVDFSGAVGPYFKLEAEVSPAELEAGNPIRMRLAVSGAGNPDAFPLPRIEAGDSFKAYEPEIRVQWELMNDQIFGTKTVEHILVPAKPGHHTIPPVSFSYFNTTGKRYETLKQGPFLITVNDSIALGPGEIQEDVFGGNQKEIRLTGHDVFPIYDRFVALEREPGHYSIWELLVFVILIPTGVLTVAFLQDRYWKHYGDAERTRYRHAFRIARRELDEVAVKEGVDFYTCLRSTISQFTADKLRISSGGMTAEKVEESLLKAGLPAEEVEEVRALLVMTDGAAYGGGASSEYDRQEITGRARAALSRLNSRLAVVSKRRG